jgi:cell division protein FtsL
MITGSLSATGPWKATSRTKGSLKRRVRALALTLLAIALLVTVYLFFVSSRLWVVNLGYRTSQALREQAELLEVNAELKLEKASLLSPDEIERNAKAKLGMREAQPGQVRFVR